MNLQTMFDLANTYLQSFAQHGSAVVVVIAVCIGLLGLAVAIFGQPLRWICAPVASALLFRVGVGYAASRLSEGDPVTTIAFGMGAAAVGVGISLFFRRAGGCFLCATAGISTGYLLAGLPGAALLGLAGAVGGALLFKIVVMLSTAALGAILSGFAIAALFYPHWLTVAIGGGTVLLAGLGAQILLFWNVPGSGPVEEVVIAEDFADVGGSVPPPIPNLEQPGPYGAEDGQALTEQELSFGSPTPSQRPGQGYESMPAEPRTAQAQTFAPSPAAQQPVPPGPSPSFSPAPLQQEPYYQHPGYTGAGQGPAQAAPPSPYQGGQQSMGYPQEPQSPGYPPYQQQQPMYDTPHYPSQQQAPPMNYQPAPSSPIKTVCLVCGRENQPGATFCEVCGGAVEAVRLCPSCGSQIMPMATYCSTCGYSFQQMPPQQYYQ